MAPKEFLKNLSTFTAKIIAEAQNKMQANFLSYHFDREELLATMTANGFHAKYPEIILHHITLVYPFDRSKAAYQDGFLYSYNQTVEEWEQTTKTAKIVGYADGGDIEAFVVEIDGLKIRPKFQLINGNGEVKIMNDKNELFHITFSKQPGVAPKKSNDAIAVGYQDIDGPTFSIRGV